MASSDTYFSDQDDYDYDYDDCYDRAFEYDDFCANSSRGGGGASMGRRQASKMNQKKKGSLGVYSSKHVRMKESLIATNNGTRNRSKANRSSIRRKR